MEQVQDKRALVRFALDMGERLLVSGSEVSRVEDTVTRILTAYGATRVDVFTIISCISLTAEFADGSIETQIRRVSIKAYTTDFDRFGKLNALSRRVCAELPSIAEANAWLQRDCALRAHPKSAELYRGAGYLLAGGAFAVFFGGTLFDAAGAMLVCCIAWLIDLLFKRLDLQRLLHTFLVSLIAAVAALPIVLSGIAAHPANMLMGTIMLLIPGISITNSMRDLLIGDTISGILRLVESLLVACCVAAGFGVAIAISRGVLPSVSQYSMARETWVQVLTAALGTLGFGMTFRLPYQKLLLCTLGGGLTWAVYLLLLGALSSAFLCTLVAAAFGAIYAEILARLCKAPATLFTMLAEIALIPGGKLYLTMDYLVLGERANALDLGSQTASTALAIALGVVFVAALSNLLAVFRKRARRFVG